MTTDISRIDQVLTPGWVIEIMQADGYKFQKLQDDGVIFHHSKYNRIFRVTVNQSEPTLQKLIFMIEVNGFKNGDKSRSKQNHDSNAQTVEDNLRHVEDLSR